MTKRLVPHGNGAALVIDNSTLQLLGIDANAELEVTIDGQNLILSPPEATQAEAELLASLERVNQAHHVTLKKLAQ